MTIESGPLVALRYVRERTRGTTPVGVGTPKTDVEAEATGSMFKRAAGSWITDGYAVGQRVKSAGFTTAANNGTWLVTGVTATELSVYDPGATIVDELADVSQSVQILMNELRTTERPANLEKETLRTAEVRSDRQVSDVRHGFRRGVSDPGFEWSLAAYDDFLELMLCGTWTAISSVSGINIGANASTKKFDRASGSFITDGYRPGDIVRVSGFAGGDAGNNGDFPVLTVTALEITVSDPDNVMVTSAAAAGRTIAYPGKRLDVGSTLATVTLEQVFAGIAKYRLFKGMALNQMSFSIQPEAIVGGVFNLLGMNAAAFTGSAASSVDPYPKPSYSPFAAFDGKMYEGGALIAIATGVSADLTNNHQLAPVIGSNTSPDVFQGTFEATGQLTAYFEDETLFNKFVNETETSMYVKLQDPTTSTDFINIVFPRVKYTGARINPPQEGPVPVEMPFQALVKALSGAGGTTVYSCLTIQRSNT